MNFKLFFTAFIFFTCSGLNAQQVNQPVSQFPAAKDYKGKTLTYKVINAPNNTFCYDIYSDKQVTIHQPSIPGMAGHEGFKTKAAAEKVAVLVISKIKKGEMPPSVTIEEMKKLKAIP